MDNSIMSLRQYINNKEQIDTIKVQTFCRLMKMVNEAIELEERHLIRINLDEIKINTLTGKIIFSDNLFASADDRTVAGINTGVSLMADRKSSLEHKRVAFALMILGWYVNEDHSAVFNDMIVLENFDYYMSKVPSWLQDFFVGVFRRMDYNTSFSDYYKSNFIDKIKNDVKVSFAPYNLNNDQLKKVTSIIVKRTERLMKDGDI